MVNRKFLFSSKMKMADVVHKDFSLINILNRFEIKFGFGNKTVEEVCSENKVNKWFFLAIINSHHNREYFPADQLDYFSLADIIDYLSNTHHYFLDVKIPEVQEYINVLLKKSSEQEIKNIKLLDDFFNVYVEEVKKHFSNEEDNVFPYIREVENAMKENELHEATVRKIIEQPIDMYERQHDNLEIKLTDLKNLIIKFLPPVACNDIIQKLLTELFRIEQDLSDHSHIEEKVMVPVVKQLEKKILNRYGVSSR